MQVLINAEIKMSNIDQNTTSAAPDEINLPWCKHPYLEDSKIYLPGMIINKLNMYPTLMTEDAFSEFAKDLDLKPDYIPKTEGMKSYLVLARMAYNDLKYNAASEIIKITRHDICPQHGPKFYLPQIGDMIYDIKIHDATYGYLGFSDIVNSKQYRIYPEKTSDGVLYFTDFTINNAIINIGCDSGINIFTDGKISATMVLLDSDYHYILSRNLAHINTDKSFIGTKSNSIQKILCMSLFCEYVTPVDFSKFEVFNNTVEDETCIL